MKFKLFIAALLVTATALLIYAIVIPGPDAAQSTENAATVPRDAAGSTPTNELPKEAGPSNETTVPLALEPETPTTIPPDGYTILPETEGALSWRTVHFHPETPLAVRAAVLEVVSMLNELPDYNLVIGEDKTDRPQKGEIVVSISDTACGGSLGCAQNTRTLHKGEMVASSTRIRFASRLETHPALKAMVLHEFGHAFGLDHHTEPHRDQRQIMHERVQSDMTAYREGDVKGLSVMARKP